MAGGQWREHGFGIGWHLNHYSVYDIDFHYIPNLDLAYIDGKIIDGKIAKELHGQSLNYYVSGSCQYFPLKCCLRSPVWRSIQNSIPKSLFLKVFTKAWWHSTRPWLQSENQLCKQKNPCSPISLHLKLNNMS